MSEDYDYEYEENQHYEDEDYDEEERSPRIIMDSNGTIIEIGNMSNIRSNNPLSELLKNMTNAQKLKTFPKKQFGPVEIVIIENDDKLIEINKILSEELEYKNRLSNEMIDALKPFLFCQNLSIVAKVMLLLSETSVIFKTFNKYTDEELNDIDPQDIGEEYFDYLLRVNPTFDVEKIHKCRLVYNQNIIPSDFTFVEMLLNDNTITSDIVKMYMENEECQSIIYHYFYRRNDNSMLMYHLQQFIYDKLVPNPMNLIFTLESSDLTKNEEVPVEFIHKLFKILIQNKNANFDIINKLLSQIQKFDPQIQMDILSLYYLKVYDEKIASVSREIIEKLEKKPKLELGMKFLSYATQARNPSQTTQTFCIDFVKAILKDKESCDEVLRELINLKFNGTNDFFRNSFEEFINLMKENVEQTNDFSIIFTNFIWLDILIQSLSLYEDNNVKPLYSKMIQKCIRNIDEEGMAKVTYISIYQNNFVLQQSSFVSYCIDYLKEHQDDFDKIEPKYLTFDKIESTNTFENICSFMMRCMISNTRDSSFSKYIQDLSNIAITPNAAAQYIEKYNQNFRFENLQMFIGCLNDNLNNLRDLDFISLRTYYKIFFCLHLVYSNSSKDNQQRSVNRNTIMKFIVKYLRCMWNDIKDQKNEVIEKILKSNFTLHYDDNIGRTVMKSKVEVFETRILQMHALCFALLKDTIRGFEEQMFCEYTLNENEVDELNPIFFYLLNCMKMNVGSRCIPSNVEGNDLRNKLKWLKICKQHKQTETIAFKLAISQIVSKMTTSQRHSYGPSNMRENESYLIEVLRLLPKKKSILPFVCSLLQTIRPKETDEKKKIILFEKPLEGKYPMNLIDAVVEMIKTKEFIETIKQNDIENVTAMLLYQNREIDCEEILKIFGNEIGMKIIFCALTNGNSRTKNEFGFILELLKKHDYRVLHQCLKFSDKICETITDEQKELIEEFVNNNELEWFEVLTISILYRMYDKEIDETKLKIKEFFDITIPYYSKTDSFTLGEKSSTILIKRIYDMIIKSIEKKMDNHYRYIHMYVLFLSIVDYIDCEEFVVESFNKIKNILLRGYYLIPSIRQAIKDFDNSLDEHECVEEFKVIMKSYEIGNNMKLTNKQIETVEKLLVPGLSSIQVKSETNYDNHYSMSLNSSLIQHITELNELKRKKEEEEKQKAEMKEEKEEVKEEEETKGLFLKQLLKDRKELDIKNEPKQSENQQNQQNQQMKTKIQRPPFDFSTRPNDNQQINNPPPNFGNNEFGQFNQPFGNTNNNGFGMFNHRPIQPRRYFAPARFGLNTNNQNGNENPQIQPMPIPTHEIHQLPPREENDQQTNNEQTQQPPNVPLFDFNAFKDLIHFELPQPHQNEANNNESQEQKNEQVEEKETKEEVKEEKEQKQPTEEIIEEFILSDEELEIQIAESEDLLDELFEILTEKGILGIPYEKLTEEEINELTPLQRAFIKNYENYGIELIEGERPQQIKGSDEMKKMFASIQPIEIDTMELAIKRFIEEYDKNNKFIMRVIVEFIFDESERKYSKVENKQHLKESVDMLFTYIAEKIEEEEQPQQTQQENVPMVQTRNFGRVPIPPGYDPQILQFLGDMAIEEIEIYYTNHPRELPQNNANNKEKISFNMNAIHHGTRYSNGSIQQINMRKKMDNNIGNRYGSIYKGSSFNDEDFEFEINKAIMTYLNSNKMMSKIIVERIIQLVFADRSKSDDINMNLQLYLVTEIFPTITNDNTMKRYLKLIFLLMKIYNNNGSRLYPQTYIAKITEMFESFFTKPHSFEVSMFGFMIVNRFYEMIRQVKNKISFDNLEAIYRYFAIKGKINKLQIDQYRDLIIEKPKWIEILQIKINEFIQGKLLDEEEFYYYITESINSIELPLFLIDYKEMEKQLKTMMTETRILIIYNLFRIIEITPFSLTPEIEKMFEMTQNKVKKMLKINSNLINTDLAILNKLPNYLPFEFKMMNMKRMINERKDNNTLNIRVNRNQVTKSLFQILRNIPDRDWKKDFVTRFDGEQGVGVGLKKEMYTLFSNEIASGSIVEFLSEDGTTVLPNPTQLSEENHIMYRFIGKMFAKMILDECLTDVHFHESFIRLLLGLENTIEHIDNFDAEFAKSIEQLKTSDVTDLGLTFSITETRDGKNVEIELKPNGKTIDVTEENKNKYIDLYVKHKYTSRIQTQVNWFAEGFYNVLDANIMKQFNEHELELVMSGNEIDVADLKKNTVYTNYQPQSIQIVWFWEIVEEYGKEDRMKLLRFVTGQNRAPIGGFSQLKDTSNHVTLFNISLIKYTSPDTVLPTAHTCSNTLDLPEYSSKEILEEKLLMAITECIRIDFV